MKEKGGNRDTNKGDRVTTRETDGARVDDARERKTRETDDDGWQWAMNIIITDIYWC